MKKGKHNKSRNQRILAITGKNKLGLFLAVFAMAMAICLISSCGDKDVLTLDSFSESGCKAVSNEKSFYEDDSVHVQFSNNSVQIYHYNSRINCGYDTIYIQSTLNGSILSIREYEEPVSANCTCPVDIFYTIKGISNSDVSMIIINHRDTVYNGSKNKN